MNYLYLDIFFTVSQDKLRTTIELLEQFGRDEELRIYFRASLSLVNNWLSSPKRFWTIFSSSSPVVASISSRVFFASATKSGSLRVAMKPLRRICTRSLGVPGGTAYRRVMASWS